MIYGEGLVYSEDEFIEIDVTGQDDLVYNIYCEDGISTESFLWELYKRSEQSDSFSLVEQGNISSGILNINFNDYGLQFNDNNFLIRINRLRTNTL